MPTWVGFEDYSQIDFFFLKSCLSFHPTLFVNVQVTNELSPSQKVTLQRLLLK